MTAIQFARNRRAAGAAAAALLVGLAFGPACSSRGAKKPDKLTQELLTSSKEALFQKGKTLIEKKKWEQGRKYLTYVFETYPNDTVGRDALLLVADSYVKQGGSAAYTEARYRYRDYLNRYPDAPRRDYARYQFAYCSDKEHGKPDRDQSPTREAIQQYQALIREYPDSPFSGAARERMRQLVDSLAEHEFAVATSTCARGRSAPPWAASAASRSATPTTPAGTNSSTTRGRPSTRLGREEEAARYYSRLLEEYPKSDYAKRARDRLKKLKVPTPSTEEKQAQKPQVPQASNN